MANGDAPAYPPSPSKGHKYHFFLSFSGFDSELATRAYDLLTAEGYKVCIQHHDFEPGKSLFAEINRALETSEKVIAIFTPNYLAASTYTEIEFYAAFRQAKLLIFRFDNAAIPAVAADQIRVQFPDQLHSSQSLALLQTAASHKPVRFAPTARRIYLSKNMPGWKGAGGHANLLGRDGELAKLTEAFKDEACSVACVIADGGFGKSALVQRWLADIQHLDYLGIQAGFAYSFYKQGWEAGSAMTSAPFFAECLCALTGISDEKLPPGGEEAWAKEIISMLQTRRTLLVLDGLEPHQQPRGAESEGHINNKTLHWFLRELKDHVRMRGGLCIVTASRIMAPELESDSGWQRTMQFSVGPLDHPTRVEALKRAGLNPNNADIDEWARQSLGHPLLIALLAPAIETGRYDPSMFRVDQVMKDSQTPIPEAVKRVAVWHLNQVGEEPLSAPLYSRVRSLAKVRGAEELIAG